MRFRSALFAVCTVAAAGLGLRILHDVMGSVNPYAAMPPLALMTFAVAAFIDAER